MSVGKIPETNLWTDLETFQKTLPEINDKIIAENQIKTAKPNYAQSLSTDGTPAFVYDPFQSSYQSQEEYRALIKSIILEDKLVKPQTVISGSKSFNMGDIPYRDANYFSYYYGHTGTITQLDFDVNKLRGSLSVNNSTITEAAGYNSGVRYAQMNTSFFCLVKIQLFYAIKIP